MPGADHYFSPSPGSRRRDRTVTLRLRDVTLDLRTDRGVFSAGRVDPGTLLLLKHAPLPPPPAGNGSEAAARRVLADVGCGYGPIAVTLALRAPDAAIWAVDVNERARELAAANLATAGVTVGGGETRAADSGRGVDRALPEDGERDRGGGQATVCAPEEVPAALRFDAVYCNPPVRIGNEALDELLRDWLSRLRPGGFAVLVMHKNLGADSLVRRLADAGTTPRRLAIGGGYRVLQVPAAGGAGS
ncbi:MAG: methyltransferase [bacterium]|nr:methyltransferase [bacterium]MXV90690.1 methyltransferase [Acidimicrobiia bacterium]MYC45135.1 methyltransferase [Acidimicrobiia bacterium]